MRKGWKRASLGDLGKCINGLTYSPTDVTDSTGLLVLRSSNVQNGKLSFDDNVYVTKLVAKESLTKEGDILVCVRNGSKNLIGKNCLITKEASGNAHGAFMTLFRSQNPEFVYQLLQTDRYYNQVRRNLGATINSINTSDFYEFTFDIPPLPEQHKIAAILRTWDDAIEKISSLISKQKQEKHIFQAKIFSGMLIPKSHKKKNTSLYDLADWHNGLAFKNIDFSETGRPVLKIAELKAGVTSTTAFTNGKYAENVLVKSGDLLFSWSGNPDTSIDAFIWDGPEGWLNQHIFRVVPKPDVQKEYLYQFLRHIKNRLAYIATGKQSTGLGHVTKADMKRTYLVLPDMDDQIKISGLLNNYDVLISGLERQKKIFQSQKRGLMQKLLTGQWRVNVSGDAEAA